MKNLFEIFTALFLALAFCMPAIAQEDADVASNRPIGEIRDIFSFFHTPANVVQIQVASDKTLYAWQNMSAFQYTMQIERDGAISALPEKIDPKIGEVTFTRPGEKPETVGQHFDTSHMDALLVLHHGNVVYERYKTISKLNIRSSIYDVTNRCNLRCKGCFFFSSGLPFPVSAGSSSRPSCAWSEIKTNRRPAPLPPT